MKSFTLSAFADEIDPMLDKQMDILDICGIKFIEMRGVNGKNLTEYTLEEVKEIKKQLDKRGFKISAIGSPIGKIKITDSFTDHFKLFLHTLEIAEILETKYIRMFSFYIPEGEIVENHRTEVMKRIQKFVAEAEKNGIVLLHENEKDIYGDTPNRCLDLLTSINSKNFRATFDPANFIQTNQKVYPEAYEVLKDFIEYVHIKDARNSDHKVVPAGSCRFTDYFNL